LQEERAPLGEVILTEVLPSIVDDREEKGEVGITYGIEALTGGTSTAGICLSGLRAVEIAGIGIGQSKSPFAISAKEELSVRDDTSLSCVYEPSFDGVMSDEITKIHGSRSQRD